MKTVQESKQIKIKKYQVIILNNNAPLNINYSSLKNTFENTLNDISEKLKAKSIFKIYLNKSIIMIIKSM